MDQTLVIAIELGNITISFNTDHNGSGLEASVDAIKRILKLHGSLLDDLSRKTGAKVLPRVSPSNRIAPMAHKGKAETSLILRRIEDALLPKRYFSSARTTGEVKSELKARTGIDFTSRKVSQALGVLFKKRVLARVGSKGNFKYIQQ